MPVDVVLVEVTLSVMLVSESGNVVEVGGRKVVDLADFRSLVVVVALGMVDVLEELVLDMDRVIVDVVIRSGIRAVAEEDVVQLLGKEVACSEELALKVVLLLERLVMLVV